METFRPILRLLPILIVVFAPPLLASQAGALSQGQCIVVKQRCKLRMKQTRFGFKFAGIDFSAGPLKKVGAIELDTQLIQKLTDIAQILDQMQLSRCQLLNATTSCDSSRQHILLIQALAQEQLGQLAILAQMYSTDNAMLREALLSWIATSADLVQKIYARVFTGANEEVTKNVAVARDVLQFAVTELGISPSDRAGLQKLLEDPLRAQLK